MTDESINKAIAQACGWKRVSHGWESPKSGFVYLECELKTFAGDFVNDLNAMHEAEKLLTREQQETYARWLWNNVVNRRNCVETNDWFCHITCLARQRAEAFLKTLNLWRNE